MALSKLPITIFIALSIVSCTWVKTTPEGEKVRVLSTDEVSSCKKLGKTEVSLKHRVAGFKRNQDKVKTELETLARNTAVNMDGDTVVPVTESNEGKQTFAIYRCINP